VGTEGLSETDVHRVRERRKWKIFETWVLVGFVTRSRVSESEVGVGGQMSQRHIRKWSL
jgi:hypothetical protein